MTLEIVAKLLALYLVALIRGKPMEAFEVRHIAELATQAGVPTHPDVLVAEWNLHRNGRPSVDTPVTTSAKPRPWWRSLPAGSAGAP